MAKICSEPIGAEPRVVEDQLNRAKALHNEIIANRKLIDDARQAAFNLLSSLDDGQLSAAERRAIEETPNELQQRYDAIAEAMANRCADLDSALVASQGVMDALGNIEGWLNLRQQWYLMAARSSGAGSTIPLASVTAMASSIMRSCRASSSGNRATSPSLRPVVAQSALIETLMMNLFQILVIGFTVAS